MNHLGIQVDSNDFVSAALSRAKAAGLPVKEEMDLSCCHANQNKFWVEDPDGIRWDVYHLNYDIETELLADGKGIQATVLPSCGCWCLPCRTASARKTVSGF